MRPGLKLMIIIYVVMLIVIFVLPYFSVDYYSIISNTTSQLGAQQTPNAWIMNAVFVLLGFASIVAGWEYLQKFWFQKVIILIFGLSLIFSGIYHHAPIDLKVNYDIREDELHSLFAYLTGFSFTIFAISMAFILQKRRAKQLALVMGVISITLSVLVFGMSEYSGLWQRVIFIGSFGWLIHLFKSKSIKVYRLTM